MHTSRRPSQVLIAVVFSLVISLTALPSSAQQSAKGKAAADATTALLQLNSNYQQTPAAQKTQLLTQFRGMAAQRQQLLSSLIQTNPGDVLRVGVPANIRGTMPATVQTFVEQQVQAQGTLEILHSDFGSPAKGLTGGKFYYHLKTATEVLTLHFAEKAPTHLLTGSIVRANGVRVGNDVALACCSATNTSNLQTVSSVLPNTFGAQSTLVMLVNFQDNATQPYASSSAQDVVFNQTSSFDMENSLQQSWLTGTVVGWYTLPINSTTCDYSSIATYANQAATAAGVNLSSYKHYVYAFPNVSACGWWGLGTVGGAPSQAWINGSIALKVVGHEMGHNLGLYHSHSMSCGTTQTLCPSPTISEYGDSIDMMGSPGAGHFNAFQKERLGWLNYGISPPITTVQSSGTYSIGPYENQDSTTKALKILQSTDPTSGAHTWYYVEFRQPTGEDSFLSNNSNVQNGVLVHSGADNDANSSELLNLAPSLNSFYTSALDVGQSFIDTTAGLTLQTLSASPSGASVSVVFGTPVCAHFNPTVSISPYQSQTVQAGAAVLYTISVTNNDNAGCTSSIFNLAASVPSGWNAGYASPTLTLSPGGSSSTTLQVTSPTGASTGIYIVTAAGTNSSATSFTGSASATYVLNTTPCINANPTVTLSPNQSQSVQPGTTVMYVIAVKNNDNSSCNSSTFQLSDSVPSGWSAVLGMSTGSLTIAPGGQGSTSLNVTSPSGATGGSYSVSGAATNAAATNFSASTSATYVVAGGSTCTRGNPTVTISPSQSQSVTAGTAVNFTVSVKNNDSSACTSSSFNLGASLISGWTGAWSNSALSLSPGGSSSATLTVTSPVGTANGSYGVTATATNASATSYSSSAGATYVVSTPTSTTVSVATNSSTYTGGQNVKITVSVSSGNGPVSGAPVSVTVTNPVGSSSQLSGTTGTNGTVTLSYRLRKQAAPGTYQVQASSGSTTSPSGLATTTFVVQ